MAKEVQREFVYQSSYDFMCVICKYKKPPRCSCGEESSQCRKPISRTETKCIYDQDPKHFPHHNIGLTSDRQFRDQFVTNYYRWRSEQHHCFRLENYVAGSPPFYYSDVRAKL